MKIEDLNLSEMSYNLLKSAGITTADEVLKLNEDEFSSLFNGIPDVTNNQVNHRMNCIFEIVDTLVEFGFENEILKEIHML